MNWFLSHLPLVGGIGICLVVLSFLRIRKPTWVLLGPGMLVCIAAIIGFVHIAVSPPGGEPTDDWDKHPQPTPKPTGQMELLRGRWDSTGDLNWPLADLLASMSDKAYLTPVEAKASYRSLGFGGVEPFTAASMNGYVISFDDVAVIAFRGTDDTADWVVNLDALTAQTPHGEVHKGFFAAYQTLKPQIMALLGQTKPKHLWVTGHSLGGALAVVCAYDLVENEKRSVNGVMTFGQPMVAHEEFAEYLGGILYGRYAHFVNDTDPSSTLRGLVYPFYSGVPRTCVNSRRMKLKL